MNITDILIATAFLLFWELFQHADCDNFQKLASESNAGWTK